MFHLLRVREREEVACVLPFEGEGERKWPMFYVLRVREREEVAYVLPLEGEGERGNGVCSSF